MGPSVCDKIAASSDCSRPVNDYVHIEAADLCRPNARFTQERQGYQVLTPFGKLGYSRKSNTSSFVRRAGRAARRSSATRVFAIRRGRRLRDRQGAGCDGRRPTGQDGERLWPPPAVARAGSDDHVGEDARTASLEVGVRVPSSGPGWRTRSSATSPSSAMVFSPGVQTGHGSEAVLGCEPRHLRPLQHHPRAGTARRRGPTGRLSGATGAGGASPPAAPPRPALPPRAPPRPFASCDAPPRKGTPYAREPGGGGRDTACLCAAGRVEAQSTGRPAIVAHVATGRADAAEHGHAPGPTEPPGQEAPMLWAVTRAVAEMLTPSTRRLATWSNSRRLQRRPRYAVPVFVLSVPPHTVQRYRRRRPDFVTNQPWPTMLRAGLSKVVAPKLAARPLVDRIHRPSVNGAANQQRPAQAPDIGWICTRARMANCVRLRLIYLTDIYFASGPTLVATNVSI